MKFEKEFPEVLIGNFYKSADSEQKELDDFIRENNFLTQDSDYIDYLKRFSALSYFNPLTDGDLTLFGFDSGKTITFLNNEFPEEPLVDDNGYMLIGHLIRPKEEEQIDFYFNSKSVKCGIFVKKTNSEGSLKNYELLCPSFSEFLEFLLVQKI
ncbi:hypothetical protein [Aquimarina hainanensis]|uniref:hypothetical protein n=1 Tax=Aquimarina hainanensis TaxID=1578017 RepID=UPI00361E698B